jgi:Ca2+-binding RTX toxin-like protein
VIEFLERRIHWSGDLDGDGYLFETAVKGSDFTTSRGTLVIKAVGDVVISYRVDHHGIVWTEEQIANLGYSIVASYSGTPSGHYSGTLYHFTDSEAPPRRVLVEGDDQNNTLRAATSIHMPVTLMGGAGDDVLVGGAGINVIGGGDGNDLLIGGRKGDSITGGYGNDTLIGDSGDDSLYGDAGRDVLTGGGGADLMRGGSGDDLFRCKDGIGDQMWGEKGIDAIVSNRRDPDDVFDTGT